MARYRAPGSRVRPPRRRCRVSRAGLLSRASGGREGDEGAPQYARGARAVYGHGIRQLIERLDNPNLGGLLGGARELDLLYLPTRYPTGLDDGTPEEAFSSEQSSRALGFAEEIIAAATSVLKPASEGG